MDTQAVLKAAGVGAAVLVVLTIASLIPCVGCLTFLLNFVVYVGIGVLAAYWMMRPRNANSGAVNGAIATAVAALIAGIVNGLIQGAYFALTGASSMGEALASMPPEQLEAMAEMGIDPAILMGGGGIAAIFAISAVCCMLWVVLAAALGAAGGAYWGSSHPN